MSQYQHVLLGGLFIGVLSVLPVVSSANACCCLWVVVGGLLTAYLQQQALQQQAPPRPLESGEAALSGALAGLVGAVFQTVALAVMLSGDVGAGIVDEIRRAIDSNPQIPIEVRDRILNLASGLSLVVLMAAVTIPMYAVFAMLGALLGFAIFRKRPAVPPAPPPQQTPQWPPQGGSGGEGGAGG